MGFRFTQPILLIASLVRSRGLEPPRVSPLAPQASASTNSATTAYGLDASANRRGAGCNKSAVPPQGPGPVGPGQRRSGARGSISVTSTAMRLPLTTTFPLATGRLLA